MDKIYPYKKFYIDIDESVYKALNYKPIIIRDLNLFTLSRAELFKKYGKFQKYKNGFFFIITDSKIFSKEINNITDYFTEHCRVSTCHREYNSITPFEYFNKHKIEIATILENNVLDINFENLNRFMEKDGTLSSKFNHIPSLCSNYKLTYLLGILNHFKPKRWLDMSAGWGDRLCSAYLYNLSKIPGTERSLEYYYGIDPSDCLNSNNEFSYKSIMEYFKDFDSKNSQRCNLRAYIHKGPAETSPLLPTNSEGLIYPELKSYDFIFTSPPFFTFEIYGIENSSGKGDSNQSINQYNTIDLWLNNFLFKTIDRSWELLEKNGNYLMYIEDKPEYRFIDKMLNFMKTKKGCIYDGIIYQTFYDPKYTKKPYVFHTVYCFRKII